MSLGIDCSNYGGVPQPSQAACMRDEGFDFVIVGTQNEDIARRQLDVFVPAGFHCELYYYPRYVGDVARLDRVFRLANGFQLTRVWDDVEWNIDLQGPEPGPAFVLPHLRTRIARVQAEGLEVGIYTGEHYWRRMTGNSAEFSHLKLWHAGYGLPAYTIANLPSFDAFRPYGGWARPFAWQFHGTTELCGFSVDLNVTEVPLMADVDPGPVVTPPDPVGPPVGPPPPPDPTLEVIPGANGLAFVDSPSIGFAGWILYNQGVPIWRFGGATHGETAKNFGGAWQWLRNEDGKAVFRASPGD